MPKRPYEPAEDERLGSGVLIRLSDGQKKVLAQAASREGLGLSSWLRQLGLREARKMGLVV